jgi:ATP phosphoribosyltransferase
VKNRDRLRIAAQKNGRLSDPARELMARSGLSFRESRDRLFCFGESQPVDLLLVRDDDIPGLIAEGTCDYGIVGRNVLDEQALDRAARGLPPAFKEVRALGFGRCRLSIALPQDMSWNGPQSLAGLRIATSYPALLEDWLKRHNVRAEIVILSGSVEIAPRLGKAEAICDLVSTGGTLAANQLREAVVIHESEAVLAGPAEPLMDERGDIATQLLRRLDGVLQVRDARLLMLETERALLDEVLRLLPSQERPTIMSLDGQPQGVSVQAICQGSLSWQQLEDLKKAGARRLLVLPVEQMLT